jgi:hypothetical protein
MPTSFFRSFGLPLAGLVLLNLAAGNRAAAQTPLFTPGDIIVSTYGNVNGALDNNPTYSSTDFSINNDGVPTPITLEEFSSTIVPTDTDTPILTDTLPTTASGANVGIVGEDGSSSEGTLQLSGNGQYLTIGGYDGNQAENGAPSGGYSNANGTALAQSTDANVPRVAALIDAQGNVNTSTVLNDVYNAQNIRSVYTTNGSTVYTSGQSGQNSTQGIFYTTTGNNTASSGTAPTEIYNAHDTRDVQAYGGNLYYSMNTTSHAGVFEYNGLPTTGSATATELTPLTGSVNGQTVYFSPEGYYFASPTVLYVADTGAPKAYSTSNPVLGDGGIQKWVLTSGTWTLEYTLTPSNFVADSATTGETGFAGIAGQVVNGVVDLYAVSYTASDAGENGLYAVADSLAATTANGETMTELEQSGTNGTFKGIAFAPTAAPEPSTVSLMVLTLLGVCAFTWKRRAARAA